MGKYIDKDTLVAEIDRLDEFYHLSKGASGQAFIESLLSFIDTLEEEEVDFEKEYKDFINSDNGRSMFETAKHFFGLGMRVSNPITAADRGTAEEIIVNLKRVEQDYRINLTKEIEWLRNKVKKGEEV